MKNTIDSTRMFIPILGLSYFTPIAGIRETAKHIALVAKHIPAFSSFPAMVYAMYPSRADSARHTMVMNALSFIAVGFVCQAAMAAESLLLFSEVADIGLLASSLFDLAASIVYCS